MPEYKRTFGGGDQDGDAPARAAVERTFASVFYNNERNAARTLIAEGLATVARHGQADERSTMYAAQASQFDLQTRERTVSSPIFGMIQDREARTCQESGVC